MNEGYGMTIYGFLATLLNRRRLVLAVAAIAVGLSLVVAAGRPARYTSTFSFVSQASGVSPSASLAGLAGQFGVSLGGVQSGAQPPQFFADLLRSREILEPVSRLQVELDGDTLALSEILDVDAKAPDLLVEQMLQVMRTQVVGVSVAARTTGVVTVSVKTPHAEVSRAVALRLIDELNAFNVSSRRSQAGEERRFVEGRVQMARDSLRQAEARLEEFLRRNRNFQASPQLELAHDRLSRTVTTSQAVLQSLEDALREASIREVRDTPVLSLIDRPRKAAAADPRGRLKLLLAGLFGGLASGVLVALLVEGFSKTAGKDPELHSLIMAWQRMRGKDSR